MKINIRYISAFSANTESSTVSAYLYLMQYYNLIYVINLFLMVSIQLRKRL
jgi:hypothetical protein